MNAYHANKGGHMAKSIQTLVEEAIQNMIADGKIIINESDSGDQIEDLEVAKLRDEARKKGAWSAAINSEVARGKAAGLYIEQKIIRTGKLEDLTADELEARMKQIIDEYSPILEGVEVEELKEKVKDYSLSSPSSSSNSSSES